MTKISALKVVPLWLQANKPLLVLFSTILFRAHHVSLRRSSYRGKGFEWDPLFNNNSYIINNYVCTVYDDVVLIVYSVSLSLIGYKWIFTVIGHVIILNGIEFE